jgi:tetratricopeptide (TPR) repeat protein
LLGERHPNVTNCFHNIAVVIGQQGQLDEALKMHIKALKIRHRTLGEDHVSVGDSLHDIAIVYGSQDDYDEALEMFEEALAVYTRALGIDNHENARVHQSIVRAKSESGDMVGALENSREAGSECRRRTTFPARN